MPDMRSNVCPSKPTNKGTEMKILLTLLLTISAYATALDSYTIDMIKRHEGYRTHAYKDRHTMSIGYGINLKYGLTEEEASLVLEHRIALIHKELSAFKWYTKLSYKRKTVLINMRYQLGQTGFMSFKAMLWCIRNNYWNAAGNQMILSDWYHQSGTRAKELVKIMKEG